MAQTPYRGSPRAARRAVLIAGVIEHGKASGHESSLAGLDTNLWKIMFFKAYLPANPTEEHFFPDYFREDVVDFWLCIYTNPILSLKYGCFWMSSHLSDCVCVSKPARVSHGCFSSTSLFQCSVDISVDVNHPRRQVRMEDEGLLLISQICWAFPFSFRQVSPFIRGCNSQLRHFCPGNHLLRRRGAAAAAAAAVCTGV